MGMENGATSRVRRRARRLLVWSSVVTLVLYLVPHGRQLVYPIHLLSGFLHQMGAGLAAVLMGAELDAVRLFSDGTGGTVVVGSMGHRSDAVVAAGGVLGPTLTSVPLHLCALWPKLARITWIALGVALVLCGLWVASGWFSGAFVLIAAGACLWLARNGSRVLQQGIMAFVATQLAISALSDDLFSEFVMVDGHAVALSDTARIARAMGGSYWTWGVACGLLSCLVWLLGVSFFWRVTAPSRANRPTAPGVRK